MIDFKKLAKVFIILIIAIPIPFAIASMYCNTENVIYGTFSGGKIFLEKPFYTTKISFSNDFLMFENFNYGSDIWVDIGFSCKNTDASMTINNVENDYITYTVGAPRLTESKTKIYCWNKGKPESVFGSNSWSYNSGNTTLLVTSMIHYRPQEIIVDWRTTAQENEVDTLITNRNYLGAIVQIYYEAVGPYLFWTFFLLPIFGTYYIRKQSLIPVVILTMLIFAIIQPVIPAPAFGLAGILIVIGIAVILYRLTAGRHER